MANLTNILTSGLIIDAFGELRDQMESVKANMESNCFICGLGKDYFDAVPRGFDTHVMQEHNLANYMYVYCNLQKFTPNAFVSRFLFERFVGSSLCISLINRTRNTRVRKPTCGKCISKDRGTFSRSVTASVNKTRHPRTSRIISTIMIIIIIKTVILYYIFQFKLFLIK